MDTLDYSERKDLKPALLIINPVSGKRMVLRNVAQIIRVLMDAGYKVTTMITGKKGDGTAFAASFGRDYQLVCCTGGDAQRGHPRPCDCEYRRAAGLHPLRQHERLRRIARAEHGYHRGGGAHRFGVFHAV